MRFYDPVKEYKGGKANLLVKLKTDELRIPLNEKDKLAVEVLDFLADKKEDLTVAEISEICDYIKFYMEFAQILKISEPEGDIWERKED